MQPQAPGQERRRRPTGVTVVAVVALLGGVFGLFGGFVALSGMASEPVALGVTVVAFGILGLVLGAGFLGGKGWAWTLGLAVYIVSLPLGVWEIALGGSGGIGGVIRVAAGVVILYYLTRIHVKAFFGKA